MKRHLFRKAAWKKDNFTTNSLLVKYYALHKIPSELSFYIHSLACVPAYQQNRTDFYFDLNNTVRRHNKKYKYKQLHDANMNYNYSLKEKAIG